MSNCPTCGEEVPEGKKYCCRECFYNRNRGIIPVEHIPDGNTPIDEFDLIDPIEIQLEEEGLIEPEPVYCDICGSPVYLGRCSRFTSHPAPKKPKSR